jgi:hypothetical protein
MHVAQAGGMDPICNVFSDQRFGGEVKLCAALVRPLL